jgi:hypothetical protein
MDIFFTCKTKMWKHSICHVKTAAKAHRKEREAQCNKTNSKKTKSFC